MLGNASATLGFFGESSVGNSNSTMDANECVGAKKGGFEHKIGWCKTSTAWGRSAAGLRCRFLKLRTATTELKWYYKLKDAAVTAMDSMMVVLDVVEKNREKIENPRGSTGGGGGFSAMY